MSTAPTARRLVRRTDDRVVAGVASGLADLLGIDPVLVRIGFVVLAFAGGAGVVAYLGLWLFTPEVEGGAPPVGATGERGPAFWIAIGLFVLAALAIADSVADRSVVWPIVLVGAGVALWRSDGSRAGATGPSHAATTAPPPTAMPGNADPSAAPPAWSPPPAPGSAGATVTQPLAPAGPGGPTAPPSGGHGGGGWTPPPARPRDRSVLGRLTVGVALLAVGVLAVLDAADVIELTFRDGIAVALLVVGAGLVVGTWVGRARWLAFPALLLLLPALVLSSVAEELDIPLRGGIGERSDGTTGVADLQEVYELGIGELTVDLGELELGGEEVTREVATAVRLGIGQATVIVPDDATVEVTWDVAVGEVELPDDGARKGRGLEGTEVFRGSETGGTLILDADVALGQLVVVRESDQPFGGSPPEVFFDGIQFGSAPRPAPAR